MTKTVSQRIALVSIQILVSFNLLYGAIAYKLSGVPFSVTLFTTMSQAVHGLISEPVFRLGAGWIEIITPILFLIPKTARLGAAVIALYMVGVLLSHVFVLGYGFAFLDALVTFALPCLFLFLTRTQGWHFGASYYPSPTHG